MRGGVRRSERGQHGPRVVEGEEVPVGLAHSTPPSAVLNATGAPSAGIAAPSRTQVSRAGAKPSAPSKRHRARSATASTASGAATRSASSPAVSVS
jgi:hypothetical protein